MQLRKGLSLLHGMLSRELPGQVMMSILNVYVYQKRATIKSISENNVDLACKSISWLTVPVILCVVLMMGLCLCSGLKGACSSEHEPLRQ